MKMHLRELACVLAFATGCGQVVPDATPDAGDVDATSPDAATALVRCDPVPAASGACVSNLPYSDVNPGLRLDFFAPAGGGRGYPLILIHGGGWTRGDKNDQDTEAQYFAAAGFAVFNINYRLHGGCSNGVPDPRSAMSSMLLDSAAGCAPGTAVDPSSHVWNLTRAPMIADLDAALTWVTRHGRAYDAAYDPVDGRTHAIGVFGASAGGHLALLSALHPDITDKASAVAAMSGPADFDFCGQAGSFTALDGEVATTGPSGTSCAYAATASLLGADYATTPNLWHDASPLWQLVHHAPTTTAQFWLLNGTGATDPGEFIPGAESESFAAAFAPLGLGADVQQLYSDADLHAASNWDHHLNGTTILVQDAIRDFFAAQLTAAAAADGDSLTAP